MYWYPYIWLICNRLFWEYFYRTMLCNICTLHETNFTKHLCAAATYLAYIRSMQGGILGKWPLTLALAGFQVEDDRRRSEAQVSLPCGWGVGYKGLQLGVNLYQQRHRENLKRKTKSHISWNKHFNYNCDMDELRHCNHSICSIDLTILGNWLTWWSQISQLLGGNHMGDPHKTWGETITENRRASNITHIDPTNRIAWRTTIKEMNRPTPQSEKIGFKRWWWWSTSKKIVYLYILYLVNALKMQVLWQN